MAAPVLSTAAASTYAAATAATVALPPTLVNGNLLIVVVSTRGTNNSFTLTDVDPTWKPVFQTASAQCEIWWKFVNGTEGASVAVSWGSSAAAVAFAMQVSGVQNLGVPIEATVQASTTSTNITMTALTATMNTDLLITVFVANVATAITVPGSMTSILGSTTGNSRCVNGATETLSASGTTGTRVATVGSSVANQAIGILVREPVANELWETFAYKSDDPNAAANHIPNAIELGARSAMRGNYKVSGHTRQAGTLDPLYRSVMLMDKYGKYIVRGQMSVNADGSYSFENLAAGEYIVMGVDQNNVQNAVVAARITAVAM